MTATSQNELTVWSEDEKVVADNNNGDGTSPLFNPKRDWRHRLSLRGSHRVPRTLGEVSKVGTVGEWIIIMIINI